MLLVSLLLTLFLSGVLLLLLPSNNTLLKGVSTLGILTALILIVLIGYRIFSLGIEGPWLMEFTWPWITAWHINFHLAVDALSFWLIALTILMGILALYNARPTQRSSSYYAMIFWAIFGVVGLFLSADIFLFFIFWEVALLPIYWMLIVHGGHSRSVLQFILLTQASGLFLMISVIGLVYANFSFSGEITFDYQKLSHNFLSKEIQYYLLFGFLLAFLIKLPAFPFHGWLRSIFSEAPAPIILVGILVKTSVFGLIRFSWPMFAEATLDFSLPMMLVGLISLLYGALVAFSQNDPKHLLAYATLSHAGLLLMGVFCPNQASFLGVFLLLITQTLSTGGLLMMIDRISSRELVVDLKATGGLLERGPRFSILLLTLLLAGFGFPLFGSFMGEWWVLWGLFSVDTMLAAIATISVILSAVYSLWLFQRLCLGKLTPQTVALFKKDLSTSDVSVYAFVVVLLLALGFCPQLILWNIDPFVKQASSWSYNDSNRVISP